MTILNRTSPNQTARPITYSCPRLILSLCDFSGSWSEPYRNAGYEVQQVDLKHGSDVLTFEPDRRPWGVLAAPPCTIWTCAAAWHWPSVPPAELELQTRIVYACINLCLQAEGFWCLENPRGRLSQLIGPHDFEFQPWWYGDAWSKRTCLWGDFHVPHRTPIIPQVAVVGGHRRAQPTAGLFGRTQNPTAELIGKPAKFASAGKKFYEARQAARSVTPPGFARAFFEVNP